MKEILLNILVILLFISCMQKEKNSSLLNGSSININENEEPPLIFKVSINDSTYNMFENEKKIIIGNFSEPEVTIKTHQWRHFPHGNLSFEYPKNFSFEAEFDMFNKIWTLSGNDLTIMYMKLSVDLEEDEYVYDLITEFGEENCSVSTMNRKISNRVFKGTKLSINIINQNLEMEIYKITTSDGKSNFLIFQDSLDDLKMHSKEFQIAIKRISKTLKVL